MWYDFTDASVWTDIRTLHNYLDELEKPTDEQIYINDCTKILMDGCVDEPLFWKQKIFKDNHEESQSTIKKSDIRSIIEKFCKLQKLDERRIKWNLYDCNVTKYNYKARTGEEQDKERSEIEALRIAVKTNRKWTSTVLAESEASIIKELVNKDLLTLCVHFVSFKGEKSKDNPTFEKSKNNLRILLEEKFA